MDFVAGVVQIVVAFEFCDDRIQQFRHAVDRRIACLAVIKCLLGGVDDVLRRIEIGLSGAERNNIASGSS